MATFDAVVHFVQSGSGTGVHVGGGRILTCAHVVDARDDDSADADADEPPERVGRQKLVMFGGSGRTFLARCVAVEESADGVKDVAVVTMGAEVDVRGLPDSQGGREKEADVIVIEGDEVENGSGGGGCGNEGGALPSALVADSACEKGGRLFCVGNPSNVDLESLSQGSISFEPPTWHTSVGQCEGYLPAEAHAAREEQDSRGRAPTRGELRKVAEAGAVSAETGTFLLHSCWTYWGHRYQGAPSWTSLCFPRPHFFLFVGMALAPVISPSYDPTNLTTPPSRHRMRPPHVHLPSGAPLFDERGHVVGLHCGGSRRGVGSARTLTARAGALVRPKRRRGHQPCPFRTHSRTRFMSTPCPGSMGRPQRNTPWAKACLHRCGP